MFETIVIKQKNENWIFVLGSDEAVKVNQLQNQCQMPKDETLIFVCGKRTSVINNHFVTKPMNLICYAHVLNVPQALGDLILNS